VTSQLVDAVLADLDADALDRLAELLAPRLQARLAAPTPDVLLTCAQAAARAGVHVESIRRAVRSGVLQAGSVGRSPRISTADLDGWVATPRRRGSSRRRARTSTVARRPLAEALASVGNADGRE
jgi:excisionase family DNA binding protein